MKIIAASLAALLGVFLVANASAQTVLYSFAFQTAAPQPNYYGPWTVAGSITTDGTLGILQSANILSWTLSTSSPQASGSGVGLNGVSGMLKFNTTNLLATEDRLILSGGSVRFLVGNLYTRIYFDFAGGDIRVFAGGLASTIPTQTYSSDLPIPVNNDGSWTIATANVPEPAAYATILGSLSLLALAVRNKVRSSRTLLGS